MPRIFPTFGYFSKMKCIFASSHSLWPSSARCRKEKQRGKVHPMIWFYDLCCQSLGTSARNGFLVFPTLLMEKAGGCWGRKQKTWSAFWYQTTSLLQPFPMYSCKLWDFSPVLLLNSLCSCWLFDSSVFIWPAPHTGICVTLEKNMLDLSPSSPHFPSYTRTDVGCTKCVVSIKSLEAFTSYFRIYLTDFLILLLLSLSQSYHQFR